MTWSYGRHKGEPIGELPDDYLLNIVKRGFRGADKARDELVRRGVPLPCCSVTKHAVDRASTRLLDYWRSTSKKDEGLQTWLLRVANAALRNGTEAGEHIVHKGLKFGFTYSGPWPVLQTVMLNDKAIGRRKAQGRAA